MQTSDRHPALLNLDVMLDDADLWGAIEWTLATARRTGLSLGGLDLAGGRSDAGRLLRLRVSAPDDSLLALFVKRLENGVDVRGVHCLHSQGNGDTRKATRGGHDTAVAATLAAAPVH